MTERSLRYLSDEWLAAYASAGAELPAVDGVDVSIQYEVSGAPDGKVRWYERIEAGVITEAAAGKTADADIAVTWKVDEALRLLRGEIGVEASFMEGGSKVEGDHVTWLVGMRPLRRSDAYQAFRQAMADLTESA